jgi:Berberine and berberine like
VYSAEGPEKYRRLSELKSKYDPENVFHIIPMSAYLKRAVRKHQSLRKEQVLIQPTLYGR